MPTSGILSIIGQYDEGDERHFYARGRVEEHGIGGEERCQGEDGGVKEMTKRVEHGKRTMFMEPSALHEEGQAYRELWPDDLGIKRLLSKQWLQWYRYHLRVNIDAVSICGLIKAPMMN
jgi:hypothetical protein